MSNRSLLEWADDLVTIKGSVSQLQAAVNQITAKAPTPQELAGLLTSLNESHDPNDKPIIDKLNGFFASPHIKVGVRLRQLYDSKQLPLLSALCKINFKSAKADKYSSYFLEFDPSNSPETVSDDDDASTSKEKKVDVSSYPPMIPPISNDALLLRVMTDKSYHQPSDILELETRTHDINRTHNEKLSILGRSLLELLLYQILDERFPNMYGEEMFVFRHKLLSPGILTKLAFGYNLVDPYKYNLSSEIDLNRKMEIFGKIFLSYVAGLSMDGYTQSEIKLWIRKLYDPILKELDRAINAGAGANASLAELNFLFKKITNLYELPVQQATLEFKQLQSDPYVAQAMVNDEIIGIGTSSNSFEEAKERAAFDIVNDDVKLKKITATLIKEYQRNRESTSSDNLLPYPAKPPSIPNIPVPRIVASPPINNHSAQFGIQHDFGLYQAPPQQLYQQLLQPQQQRPIQQQHLQNVKYTQQYPQQFQQQPQMPNMVGSPYNALQTPFGQSAYSRINARDNVPTNLDNSNNAKNNLYAILGKVHLEPDYVYYKTNNDFQATVIVKNTNTVLGVGYDINRKVAAQKAAIAALQNRSKLQELGINI